MSCVTGYMYCKDLLHLSKLPRSALQQRQRTLFPDLDLSTATNASKHRVLASTLTHSAKRVEVKVKVSQFEVCGFFPGRISVTYYSGSPLPQYFNPLGPQLFKQEARLLLVLSYTANATKDWMPGCTTEDHHFTTGDYHFIRFPILYCTGRGTL